MATERTWLTSPRSRWLSVWLLLAIFFLPFHFHLASPAAPQVAKDCICLHGSRIQIDLTATSAVSAPALLVYAAALPTQFEFDSLSVGIPSSRAPPV